MAVDDFIMTMDSDDEQPPAPKLEKPGRSQNKSVDPEDAQLNTDFSFDLAGDPYADATGGDNLHDLVKKGSRPVSCPWLIHI